MPLRGTGLSVGLEQHSPRMTRSKKSGPRRGRFTLSSQRKMRIAPDSGPAQELKGVDGLRALADLEVELRRPHLTRLTRLGNHLATLDGVPALHPKLTRL